MTMHRVKVLGVMFLVMLPVSLVSAARQADTKTGDDEDCWSADSNVAISQCWGDAFKKRDAELNTVYQKVMKELEAKDASYLRTAQKAWLGYRDANCEAAKHLMDGGTGAIGNKHVCLTLITRERTAELKRLYGDIAGK